MNAEDVVKIIIGQFDTGMKTVLLQVGEYTSAPY